MAEWDTTERRSYVRSSVHLQASLTSAYATEEATVLNVSLDGCRLRSNLAPRRDTELVIHLHWADGRSAIRIDRAVVRWSAGPDFGVQFLLVGIHEAKELQRMLKRLSSIDS